MTSQTQTTVNGHSLPAPLAGKTLVPVVSTTHYDREWRFSFQQTRLMLAQLLDHLLEILEADPAYRCYTLDGQSVILEDYLALRPEREGLVRRFIQEGRLLAGPWYTLPDMSSVGGECIVRNLLVGHRTTAPFGPPMKVGYTPTGFGQVSQLPQLLAGFGMDTALFYRGVDRARLAVKHPARDTVVKRHATKLGRESVSHHA